MPKYFLAKSVQAELQEIHGFIAQDKPDAAKRFLVAVWETFAGLAALPKIGKVRRFVGLTFETRSWHVRGFVRFLVFYREIPEGIEVLAVCHGARDVEIFFSKRGDPTQ